MTVKTSMELNPLREKIKSAREAYYNLDPIISDQEYDALIDELKSLNPQDEEVTKVGAAVSKHSVWEKVEHTIPMGSLDKVNSKDEFMKWVEETKAKKFLITYKIDGSSMELVYKQGKLVRCVTRGDGKIGEDVTRNVIQIPTVLKEISETGDTTIRGEVVMYKDVFNAKYAHKYANPRNTAAGRVRDKKDGGKDCENLTFLAYTIISENKIPTEEGQFIVLRELGFETPMYSCGGSFEMDEYYRGTKRFREDLPYEIDGMVVRVDDVAAQEELGELNMRPKGQVAWKFDPSMAQTKVINIRWSIGTSGRITPVAEVEPVGIGGVTITSISLHNLAIFKDLALFKGCRVLIARRGDVIPYIEGNLDKI